MKEQIFSFGIIFIIGGLVLLFGFNIESARCGTLKASLSNGIIFLIIGLSILLISKFIKKEKYSICPTCEETYYYQDLEDGLCPKCNIKTKDLDGYYDKK